MENKEVEQPKQKIVSIDWDSVKTIKDVKMILKNTRLSLDGEKSLKALSKYIKEVKEV